MNAPFRPVFPLPILLIPLLALASSNTLAATAGITDQELRHELYDSLRKQGPDDEPSRPFSLVNRGGISLGVYEAGVNWAVLRLLKDLRADLAVSGRLRPDLYAAADASAGAINGFIAGLFWCTEPGASEDAGTDSLNSNFFRNSWRSIDVNKLIDHENDSLPRDDAAFSRVLVREIQSTLLGALESRDFRAGCEVAFGLSLTRSNPVLVSNAGVDIAQQRLSTTDRSICPRCSPTGARIMVSRSTTSAGKTEPECLY